ncbi:MAG: hypothetical protein HYT30_00815 [Parcubacteria group bacterium]|nr:hypothetical protein [Parcubacteria group bacterium]
MKKTITLLVEVNAEEECIDVFEKSLRDPRNGFAEAIANLGLLQCDAAGGRVRIAKENTVYEVVPTKWSE